MLKKDLCNDKVHLPGVAFLERRCRLDIPVVGETKVVVSVAWDDDEGLDGSLKPRDYILLRGRRDQRPTLLF